MGAASVDPYAQSRWTLAFADRGVEAEYWAAFFDSKRRFLLASALVATAVMASFGILDPYTAGARLEQVRWLRYGLALPAMAGLLPFLTLPQLAPFGRRHIQEILVTFIGPAVGALAVICVWLVSTGQIAPTVAGLAGTSVGMMAVFGLARIRFPYAALFAVLGLVVGVITTTGQEGLPSLIVLLCCFALAGTALIGLVTNYAIELYDRRNFVQERVIGHERERSERLLRSMLPAAIAEELKAGPKTIATRHPSVSVLFADLVGFTSLSERLTAGELVTLLEGIFGRFDAIVAAHGVEKVKTIGDAYMIIAGAPADRPDHAQVLARLGLALITEANAFRARVDLPIALRVGIASGPVIAGVIGETKPAYDVWGDTVNAAARMESHGEPGRVQVTAETAGLLRDAFELEARGTVVIKGKGTMDTWWLLGPVGPNS